MATSLPSQARVVALGWQEPAPSQVPPLHCVPSDAAGGVEQAPVAGLQTPAPWHWSGAVQVTPEQ
jgi:hypothetical protein